MPVYDQPLDGCGECITADSSVAVHPHRVVMDDDGTGLRAWYRCPRCGHTWWTSWGINAFSLTCDGCCMCQPGKAA